MVFSTLLFLFIYLPVVLLLYYTLPKKWRNPVLFAVNLVFYGWGEPIYVLLMVLSTLLDYICGLGIERNRDNPKKARGFLVFSMCCNLLVLIFFKYLDFIIVNLNVIPLFSGLKPLGLALPIGISFYTFQTMSYTIDVYRNVCKGQKNFITFGTYVTLFPQLIAGPIVQYKDVEAQLEHRVHTKEMFVKGISRFATGLAKKVLLANAIGSLWNTYITATGAVTVLGSWLAVLAFTFQIYFDFSGYSDMAIGLGRMFGFEFLENFNYPYISKSITEFWRRWHISLSTWFRDNLYIPLGGSRKGKARTNINLFVVWLATGIWHGANWNFIIWGLYFFVLLMIEKTFLLKLLEKTPKFFRSVYVMFFVIIGWALFAVENIGQCFARIGAMFGVGAELFSKMDVYYLLSYLPMFIVLSLASIPFWAQRFGKLSQKTQDTLKLVLVAVCMVICTASLIDSTYNPFLYFRF